MVLSLWASTRVRQVYGKFSQLLAGSGLTAPRLLRQFFDKRGFPSLGRFLIHLLPLIAGRREWPVYLMKPKSKST